MVNGSNRTIRKTKDKEPSGDDQDGETGGNENNKKKLKDQEPSGDDKW